MVQSSNGSITQIPPSKVTIMKKYALLAALALTGTLSITACSQQEEAQQPTEQVQAAVSKPTDPNDSKAWNAFLGPIVQKNMQGMTAERPYSYLVPAGDSEDANGLRQRQLEQVQDTVARGVLPGNMLAFAGPDSGKTADFVTEAFKDAKPGSFKDVIILVIGDAADKDRVSAALQPTGATIRYVNM
jgi:hypothetical protein